MSTPHDPVHAHLRVRTDRRLIRSAARSERHLLVDVVAPSVARDPARRRPPVNLAFVLDRSGSMSGSDKLSLAKQAVLESIHRLDAEDRFSVVAYDDQIDVVMPASLAGSASRREAADRLRHLDSRGTTNLHGGWVTGCGQVAAQLADTGVNRVLLLTDGLANVGVIDPGELASQASELRARGVSTSTFGVGRDFDEQLLSAMADGGGGNFYFIGDVRSMRDHITSEVGDTLEIVARDVVLELVVPAGVEVSAVSPFRLERVGERLRVHLGDMVSGQVVQVALRLRFETGILGRTVDVLARLADRDDVFAGSGTAGQPVGIGWTYEDHERNDAQERDAEVDRFVARLGAERSRVEASRLNKEGRYREAGQVLAVASAAMAPLAAADPVVAGLRAQLDDEEAVFAAPMDALERKRRHFAAVSRLRTRSEEGRPVKAGDADAG